MGLSQSLQVTSYIKMIDIWMLFTMTIPFLEVVIHTANEIMKKTVYGPERKVGIINVKSDDNLEEEIAPKKGTIIMRLTSRVLLPTISLIFTIIFWVAGFVKPFFASATTYINKSDCLSIDLI